MNYLNTSKGANIFYNIFYYSGYWFQRTFLSNIHWKWLEWNNVDNNLIWLIGLLINFDNISTYLWLFHAKWLVNCIYCIFIFTFCCIVAHTTWLPVSRKYKRRCVSQRSRSRKRSKETALKGCQSVVRPTSDVTPTAQDL